MDLIGQKKAQIQNLLVEEADYILSLEELVKEEVEVTPLTFFVETKGHQWKLY
jgi:hypothetical protein